MSQISWPFSRRAEMRANLHLICNPYFKLQLFDLLQISQLQHQNIFYGREEIHFPDLQIFMETLIGF